MKALLPAIAVLMLVAGCAGGVDAEDSPSVTYIVPRSYQTVYVRVQNQAAECLVGKNQYDVYASFDPAKLKGSVAVKGLLGELEVARTDIEAVDNSHTRVHHAVWGRSPWDLRALHAMKQSVMMDTSVCVAYK